MIPRRVAYVVNEFPKVSETFVAGELAEVLRRGIDVCILSLRDARVGVRHAVVDEARLVERTVYGAGRFPEALRAFSPDLIHAHFATEPTAAARALAVDHHIPFTFTAHGYDVYRRPPLDWADRAAAASAVITVSHANRRHIVRAFGVPGRKIRVIPCGIDTERFRPSSRRVEPPQVVCVARLRPVKNLGLLLEACARLRARGVGFHCVVVGEGSCRDELEATRARLGLEGLVRLTGAAEQAQVLARLQRASVAALTSDSEGMPLSLMEAAACGVPVVSTAVGGVPELVEDGVTGLLAPPGDAESLARSIERLLRDRRYAARLGAAARRRVREQYSVSRQVDRLVAVWADVTRREAAA